MKVAIGILVGIGLLPFLFPRRFWPTVIPILLAIWIPITCVVLATLIHFSSVMQIMILGTALWAAIDSSKIQLKRYKSGISYGPVVVFLCFVFLWIVAFPWYLIVRNKIKAGTAILKDEITKNAA
jgi:NhaP-type Na+/H+ or K+/H+ antiporter